MEKDLLLLQDQAGGMDTIVVDKWELLKKRGTLQGHAQVMSKTCRPRDMISLVIPRVGDNMTNGGKLFFNILDLK
jgi:hypothetical protein